MALTRRQRLARLRRRFKSIALPALTISDTGNKSSRHGSKVRMIVPHTAEGGYAGTVSWLKNPASDASSQLVMSEDGSKATQLVGWDEKAWTQRSFNPVCESFELAGFLNPDKSKGQVGHGMLQMRRCARVVAFRLRRRGLPNHWVRNSERWHGRGYTRHGDLVPEGGHPQCLIWSGWRWRVFRMLVTLEYRRRRFRKHYGVNFT